MKIYTFPKSRSLRVLWTLEELGLDYETCPVDLFSPQPARFSPHPLRKVPVLEDNGTLVFETLAICQYLCEKADDKQLYPADVQQRAKINEWLSFSLTDLESPVWYLLKHKFLLPEASRSAAVADVAFRDAELALAVLKTAPARIVDKHFTLADIFLSHTLMWAQLCGLPLDNELNDYVARCQGRKTYAAALERNSRPA